MCKAIDNRSRIDETCLGKMTKEADGTDTSRHEAVQTAVEGLTCHIPTVVQRCGMGHVRDLIPTFRTGKIRDE